MIKTRSDAYTDFEIGDNLPIMTSGVVSRLLGMPVWVLKQLDHEKVVSPPRQKGRSRLYSKSEVVVLKHVWHYMNDCGVNVQGVKVILELEKKARG